MGFRIVFILLLGSISFTLNAQTDFSRYRCEDTHSGGPPYFHRMEIPGWDYPSWSWSPDSQHIVFQRHKGESQQLYILNVDTGTEYCFSQDLSTHGMPNWSPDGHHIAYVRDTAGLLQIFEKNIETGEVTQKVSAESDLLYPTYSPDGRYLAFIRIETADRNQRTLRILDLESGEESEVHHSLRWMGSPSWSPDSQHLYFHQITPTGWNDIFEAHLDGSLTTNLTHNSRADSWSANFSPDGKYMLYTHGVTQALYSRYENTEVLRKNLETKDYERLTWAWRPDDGAQYAPDGQRIVFQSNRSGYREFYMMAVDGSNQQQLTRQPETELTTVFANQGFEAAKNLYETLREQDSLAELFTQEGMESFVDARLGIMDAEQATWLADIFKETYPTSGIAYKTSGFVKLRAGNQQGALADFREALRINPMFLDIWREVGTDNYIGLLDSIPGIYTNQESALNTLGYEMMHLGDGKGAVRIFTRITEENPNAWNVFDSLGEAYMWQGNYNKALAAYRESLEQNPENTNAEFHIQRIQALASEIPEEEPESEEDTEEQERPE